MSRLAKILDIQRIRVQVDAGSKKRAFELVGQLFEDVNNLSRSLVVESLMSRERLGSTGLGCGVAVPHGRIKGLKNPTAAFLQLATPIPFSAPDDKPISLMYCLLVPEAATQEHLDILAQIVEILRVDETREKLMTKLDESMLLELLTHSPKNYAPPSKID